MWSVLDAFRVQRGTTRFLRGGAEEVLVEVRKDGSVFRIELDSSASEFETRISLAVNTHGEMRRPRLEVSQKGLVALFTRTLPHIIGEAIVSEKDWNFESRRTSIEELIRIADEVAACCVSRNPPHRTLPGKAARQIEVLGALQQGECAEPNWSHIIAAVNILMERLARMPQSLKGGYQCSPGGILNAYREGDLTFNEAVTALEKWKARR